MNLYINVGEIDLLKKTASLVILKYHTRSLRLEEHEQRLDEIYSFDDFIDQDLLYGQLQLHYMMTRQYQDTGGSKIQLYDALNYCLSGRRSIPRRRALISFCIYW